MNTKMDQALIYMNKLIQEGTEFYTAALKASNMYNVNIEDLINEY